MVVTSDQALAQLSELTPAQLQAVTTANPTVCVLASAGTGKTRVLTSRAGYRVATGSARPEHVLVVTFTRQAAGELKERLGRLGIGSPGKEVMAATFHALAASQLRRWWADRHTPEPAFLANKARLLAELMGERPGFEEVNVSDMASHIEWAKARDISPEAFAEAATRASRTLPVGADAAAALYGRYEDEKRWRRIVDYDDLLARYARALETDDRFAAAQRWRWQHVLVDELQDINPLQFRMLLALLGPNQDLFVVGDPNQAIYGWNGADPGFLDSFPRRWPQAEVVHLDDNHRSSPQVVRAAASVLGARGAHLRSARADGPPPTASTYASEESEAGAIAAQMAHAHARGIAWGRMAALARTNAQLGLIARVLEETGVPFHALTIDDGATDTGHKPEVGDRVTLCSFHRAKGLQWHSVWVCGLELGLVPIGYATSSSAMAEERRLLYVALTRAEQELHCSWAQTRRAGNGVAVRREPSPWWADIRAQCPDAVPSAPASGVAAPKHLFALARGRLALRSYTDPAGQAAAERLKDWRQRMARASGVPPHVLLHDSTIRAIAERCPSTVEDLLAVPGVGPVKVSRFGQAILEAVRAS
jgi:superfamily I DNA/RNA helicase